MPKEPFRDPSEPLFEQRMNELEEGKQLSASAITTEKIAAEAVTAPKVTSETLGKRLVCDYGFVIKAALAESATEPYLLTLAGGAPVLAAAKVAKFGEAVPAIATFPALMKISGRTSEAELYVIAYPSKAVGTVTFTFGVYTITAFGETAAQQEPTVNTAASLTAKLTNPAAKVATTATSTAGTLVENGSFLIGFTTSAATAAESLLVGKAQLYVKNK